VEVPAALAFGEEDATTDAFAMGFNSTGGLTRRAWGAGAAMGAGSGVNDAGALGSPQRSSKGRERLRITIVARM
jgi:hypothetical protein